MSAKDTTNQIVKTEYPNDFWSKFNEIILKAKQEELNNNKYYYGDDATVDDVSFFDLTKLKLKLSMILTSPTSENEKYKITFDVDVGDLNESGDIINFELPSYDFGYEGKVVVEDVSTGKPIKSKEKISSLIEYFSEARLNVNNISKVANVTRYAYDKNTGNTEIVISLSE